MALTIYTVPVLPTGKFPLFAFNLAIKLTLLIPGIPVPGLQRERISLESDLLNH
jgi:hypothetical protein